MATWSVTIAGTGPHHSVNPSRDINDANEIAVGWVRQILALNGVHTLTSATITYEDSSVDNIANPDAYINQLAANETAQTDYGNP